MEFPYVTDEEIADDKLLESAPRRWAICSCCDGEGKSSAYLGAFTSDELNDDPEFAERYKAGGYDKACTECKGTGKVKEIDETLCTPEQLAAIQRDAECQREVAEERRMRALGYEF